jgi:glycerol-3-phosphate cytidylyltransferase
MKNAKLLAGENGIHIVGILTDSAVEKIKPTPILPFEERVRIAESIKYVDLVVPQHSNLPEENILLFKPDILIESSSHSEQLLNNSVNVMRKIGGKVIVFPYYPKYSSTEIKKRIKGE